MHSHYSTSDRKELDQISCAQIFEILQGITDGAEQALTTDL
jgi:hypothetical protein